MLELEGIFYDVELLTKDPTLALHLFPAIYAWGVGVSRGFEGVGNRGTASGRVAGGVGERGEADEADLGADSNGEADGCVHDEYFGDGGSGAERVGEKEGSEAKRSVRVVRERRESVEMGDCLLEIEIVEG